MQHAALHRGDASSVLTDLLPVPRDFDKDGLIYPQDTYLGFVKLGFGWFLSLLSIPIIHGPC